MRVRDERHAMPISVLLLKKSLKFCEAKNLFKKDRTGSTRYACSETGNFGPKEVYDKIVNFNDEIQLGKEMLASY